MTQSATVMQPLLLVQVSVHGNPGVDDGPQRHLAQALDAVVGLLVQEVHLVEGAHRAVHSQSIASP